MWHHDAAGRRLKLIVFLHDVEAEGRPTMLLSGSHRSIYLSMLPQMSRIDAVLTPFFNPV
jgi:hypothetical protein